MLSEPTLDLKWFFKDLYVVFHLVYLFPGGYFFTVKTVFRNKDESLMAGQNE